MHDAVVVGAGAAGCVVARRLADAGRRVLLLEAGPDLRADVPDDFRSGWDFPRRHEWGLESEPDDRGESVPLRRGRLVGGTSWVTRFGVRPSLTDVDRWTCPGWTAGNALDWFRRIETDLDRPDDPWHGDSGPIPVTRYPHLADSEIAVGLTEACEAAGIPVIDDHNRPGAAGAARMPMTGRDGRRTTTADAYLPLDATPETLTLRAETTAATVAIEDGRAVGVRLLDGTLVEAERVVLCAGVYGSPVVLLRSGIGPADHLRELSLPVVADRSGVGANLADHPAVWLDPGYRSTGTGRPPLHTLVTFRSTASADDDPPDLAFWLTDPTPDSPAPELETLLLTPASRGLVRLRSPDPAASPVIRLPALDDERDLERLAEGLLRSRDLALHPAIRRIATEQPSPGLGTPDEARAWIRRERYSTPHTVGTCAMGAATDPAAVVDAHGCVHGVEGLAVVDASIIPAPPSGFPHLLVIMMAERLSAELAARW
jgi:choline dehydrogenase